MESTDVNRNLKVRDGTYYWRQRIKNKNYCESLHVPFTGLKKEEKEAIARMGEKQRLARDDNFSALEITRTKIAVASIGTVIERYKRAANSYGIQPATVKKNINSLKLVLAAENSQDAEDLPSSVLTGKLVRTYRDKVLSSREGDEASQDRARRTVRSTLRQARSIFARWTRDEYKGLKLPDLEEFLRSGAMRVHDKLYVYPPAALVEKTMEAGRKLPANGHSDLYSVFLLAYDCGMRAGEILAAKTDWICDGYIEVRFGKQWTTRRVGRKVPLNPETQAELKAVLRKGEQHIIPGAHKTARKILVERDFADWMRAIGWTADEYIHTTHELRALRGSKWYTEQGANVARDCLGHTSVVTTCKFYAALDKLPDALPRES